MEEVTNLTSSVRQQMQLILPNNETADFFFHYNGRMEAWFFDFTYNDITAKNLKCCLHPNILRQFKNAIPFGIAFASNNLVEPFQLESFSSGATSMFILDADEVKDMEDVAFGYEPPTQYNYIKPSDDTDAFNTIQGLKAYDGELNYGDYAFVVTDDIYAKYSYNGSDWVRA